MSDTLLGVIVGGAVASITPVITIIIEYIKWKKKVKIEHLRLKREKLEKAYQKSSDELIKGMSNNNFSIDMVSDFYHIFPKEILYAFEKFTNDKDKAEKNVRFHYYSIARTMKKSLSDIDRLIENEIK